MDDQTPSDRVSAFFAAARARNVPPDAAARLALADEAQALAAALESSHEPAHGVALHAYAANLLINMTGGRTAAELQRILGHLDQARTLLPPPADAEIAGHLTQLRASAYMRAAKDLPDSRLDEAIQACLDALALPDVATDDAHVGPLSFNAGRFLLGRDGPPDTPQAFDWLVHLFQQAHRSYQSLGLSAQAADAARYLAQLDAWRAQMEQDEEDAPGGRPAPSTSLHPSPQFGRLLGSAWVLLGDEPIELSPAADPPPFPAQMISINPMPPGLAVDQALASLQDSMAPVMWSGAMQGGRAGHSGTCAMAKVAGNPLTGDILFVLRLFPLPQMTVLLIYETTDPRLLGQPDAIVEAIEGLSWPLLGRHHPGGIDEHAGPGQPLPHLQAALSGQAALGELVQALGEPNLVHRYATLSAIAAGMLRAPDFVEALTLPAYLELVRMLEGISSTFTRIDHQRLETYAVSLLARGLLLHPAASPAAIDRALALSALLMARTRGKEGSRWEEAVLTQLLARAARTGSEDLGDLAAMADDLARDEAAAQRILRRLVDDATFSRARRLDEFSHFRLRRCDMALALMQRMLLEQPSRRLSPPPGEDDGRGPPAEFMLSPPGQPVDDGPPSFLHAYLLTAQAAFSEMERLYAVDVKRNQDATLAHLQQVWPGRQRPPLLFLRGFRSAQRVWIDNAFSFDVPYVVPYPQEPARLPIEAALVKGLGPFTHTAIGGLPDPMGMGRLGSAFDDATWRAMFDMQSQRAAVILVLPDRTDALSWELGQLVDRALLDKTVLLMAPLSLDRQAGQVWHHTSQTFAGRGIHLPAFDAAGGFLLLDHAGQSAERVDFAALTDGRLVSRLLQRLRDADAEQPAASP